MKKEIHVVAAIIEKNNDILIAKRLKGDFAGLWEFPGGKYEEGETGEEAIKREILEEFNATIEVKDFLCTVKHRYPKFNLVMDCFICKLVDEELELHDHSAIKWINNKDHIVDWVPADKKVIKAYKDRIK